MSEEVEELLQDTIDIIQRYGMCLLNDNQCDIQKDWEEISPVLMCLCDLKEKFILQQKIFSDIVENIETSSEKLDENHMVEEYRNKVNEKLNQLKLGDDNKVYAEFKTLVLKDIQSAHNESDITAVSECVVTIDPITKLPLTDPVKNNKCGHVYEKRSILQLLKVKKKVKCPIAGCVAAETVHKNDLVPDIAMKRYLESSKKI